MKMLKARKLLVILAAIFIVAAFGLALIHHHPDGQHHLDCPICRLVQQIACVLGLLFIALLELPSKSKGFLVFSPRDFTSLLLPSSLQLRAPPFTF